MFCIKEPSTLKQEWRLSTPRDKNLVIINENTLKELRSQDVLALDFLYQSYKSKLKGVILNEEKDINVRLQVSTFLGALSNSFGKQFLILILTPNESLPYWHYHMAENGKFKVQILTPETRPEEFTEETNLALLLSFSNLKLTHCLTEYLFFSVVIDSFDTVAHKMAIRKLEGDFNIGLTTRNFYTEPDQKLHWTMLNWSNPGVFGKLADFYQIDNDNFASFRNCYKTWWFRLTWSFCKSFKPFTLEEKNNYKKIITNYKRRIRFIEDVIVASAKGKRKYRKDVKKEVKDEKHKIDKKEKVVFKSKGKKPMEKIQYGVKRKSSTKLEIFEDEKEENSNSSTDTVIYDSYNNETSNNVKNAMLPKYVADDHTYTSSNKHVSLSIKEEPISKRSRANKTKEDNKEAEAVSKPNEGNTGEEAVSKSVAQLEDTEQNTQNTKDVESDDLILSFLPNSQRITTKKAIDLDMVLESDISQKFNKPQSFNGNHSLGLDRMGDSDGEAESFLHSIVGNKSEIMESQKNEGKISQLNKSRIDLKKLQELLEVTNNY